MESAPSLCLQSRPLQRRNTLALRAVQTCNECLQSSIKLAQDQSACQPRDVHRFIQLILQRFLPLGRLLLADRDCLRAASMCGIQSCDVFRGSSRKAQNLLAMVCPCMSDSSWSCTEAILSASLSVRSFSNSQLPWPVDRRTSWSRAISKDLQIFVLQVNAHLLLPSTISASRLWRA